MGRKRNLNLHVRLTKEEIDLIRTVAKLKEITITDLLLQCTTKEYEKIKKMEEANGR